jgi:hypothetical protein
VTLRLARFAVLFAASAALLQVGCGDSDSDAGGSATTTTTRTESAAGSDPAATRAKIDRLLDEVATSYDPAEPDQAAELVAEAYLENYEHIEDAVKDAAPAVNEKLEPLLGAELRKQIREGAPAAEIRAMVIRAKRLIAQGVTAVQGAGAG